jgi:hypothetical protein
MPALLIPDSGPLFSLAAADLLDVFLYFELVITDVVKEETIDRGGAHAASVEAKRLHTFFLTNKKRIRIEPTQVGDDMRRLRIANPTRSLPRNAGELSIQSLLIHLEVIGAETAPPIVLFEDGWFLRHGQSLKGACVLLSTQAFLVELETMGLIPSAREARLAIDALRPSAYRNA